MNKKTLILTLALLAGTALWAQTPEGAPTTDESKDNVEAAATEQPAEDTTSEAEEQSEEQPKIVIDPNAPLADYTAPKKYVIRNITAEGIKFLDA
jgi:hypothetical protein